MSEKEVLRMDAVMDDVVEILVAFGLAKRSELYVNSAFGVDEVDRAARSLVAAGKVRTDGKNYWLVDG